MTLVVCLIADAGAERCAVVGNLVPLAAPAGPQLLGLLALLALPVVLQAGLVVWPRRRS